MDILTTPRAHAVASLAALSLFACAGLEHRSEIAQPVTLSDGAPQEVNSRAKRLFEDAVKAYETQKRSNLVAYPALEAKFQAALAEDPNLAEADYNLGVLAERQGKKEEAVDHYQTALRKKPSLKEASESLAVIAQNEGRIPEAVRAYESILEAYPDDAGAHARLAEIYRMSGDHDRAMEMARLALMREPKSLTAQKVMMLSYLDRKQTSLAKLVAQKALKIDDSDPELYYTVGLIFLAEHEPGKAQQQFKKAGELRPDYLPAQVMLAKSALQQEDYPGAEQHLRRILQVSGKNAEAHLDLGVAYKGQGAYDKALQEYDIAEELNPQLAAIYLNRGIILHRQKDSPEKALENYKKYLLILGGAVALPADAPVFALMNEAEQLVQEKADGKRTEEETKRLELAQKAQQAKLKEAEERERRDQELENDKLKGAAASSTPSSEKPSRDRVAPQATAPKEEPNDDPSEKR